MFLWTTIMRLCSFCNRRSIILRRLYNDDDCIILRKRHYFLTRHRASTSTRWHFAFGAMLSQQRNPCTIANPPNSAQPGHPNHFLNLQPGPCSSVGMRRGTDKQTHRRPWPIYISPRLCLTRNVMKVNCHVTKLSLLLRNFKPTLPLNYALCWTDITAADPEFEKGVRQGSVERKSPEPGDLKITLPWCALNESKTIFCQRSTTDGSFMEWWKEGGAFVRTQRIPRIRQCASDVLSYRYDDMLQTYEYTLAKNIEIVATICSYTQKQLRWYLSHIKAVALPTTGHWDNAVYCVKHSVGSQEFLLGHGRQPGRIKEGRVPQCITWACTR